MEIILVQKAVVESQAMDGRYGFAGASFSNLARYPVEAAFTDERKNQFRRALEIPR
jgi:hypothetical protein